MLSSKPGAQESAVSRLEGQEQPLGSTEPQAGPEAQTCSGPPKGAEPLEPREDRPGRCPEGLAFWVGLSWAVLSTAQLQGGVFFQGGYKSQAFMYV